ncbi:hypothetical protein ACRRTK_008211 [Alexandromys fortis]
MGDSKEEREKHLCSLGSEVHSFQEQEQEKQRIHQELEQLKAGLDRLCRPCPWDWTLFQGNCYFFSTFQQTWMESVTACQEVGAQLVVIKSDEEQSFLQRMSEKKGHAWMGLSDIRKEGKWIHDVMRATQELPHTMGEHERKQVEE